MFTLKHGTPSLLERAATKLSLFKTWVFGRDFLENEMNLSLHGK